MNNHANYGWKITWVNHVFFDGEEVGTIGPSDIDPEILDELQSQTANYDHPSVYRFDLFDDDKEHYFSGILFGEEVCGDEPLLDYGKPYAGCTTIVTADCTGKKHVIS